MSDPTLESSIAKLAEIARREGGISAIEQGSDLWEHIRLASVTPGGGMYIWHRFIWSDIPPDRNRMTWRTHGPITLALEDRSIKRLWIEYPRRTLKTTLVSHAYPAWELCRLVIEPPHDPWWRFFFMSDTITNAQRLYEGVRLGHDRPKFKFFFPELSPPQNGYRRPGDRKPFKWNESEGEVIREYRTAEPTYTPIAAKKVGPHYEVGILDDLINSENYDSPSAVEKAIDFYKFAVNLLEDYHENRLIGVGNSWNIGDLNEHIHKEAHRTGMVILSVSAETGPNFDGDHACKNLPEPIRELMKRIPAPAWPERFDEEALAALRVEMGPRIYCFPPGTPVVCRTGLKPIEEVVPGVDEVWTHEARWKPVERLWTREVNEDLVEIETWGGFSVRCTQGHELFALNEPRYRGRPVNHQHLPEFDGRRIPPHIASEVKHVRRKAGTLNVGDALVFSHPEETATRSDDPRFWWLVGLWLGDGWLNSSNEYVVAWCAAKTQKHLMEKARDYCKELGLCQTGRRNVHEAEIVDKGSVWAYHLSNKAFASWLRANFGSGALNKHLSPEAERLPPDLLEALWRGYMAADGFIRRGYECVNSVSRSLLEGFARAFHRLGASTSVTKVYEERTYHLRGKTGRSGPLWCLSVYRGGTKARKSWASGQYAYRRIRKVEHVPYSGPVYNLQVSDDHTYSVGGLLVGNSSQMLNSPIDPEVTEFDESKVKEFYVEARSEYADTPCLILSDTEVYPLTSLNLYVAWDPALGKTSKTRVSKKSENAVVVTFVTPDWHVGVLDEFAEICTPYKAMDVFLTYCKRYAGYVAGAVMDETLFQEVLKDLLRDRIRELALHAPLRKVKIPKMMGGKDARIRAWLSHYIEKGSFYVNRACPKIRRQIRQFGVEGAKRDLLDATALATKIWRRPETEVERASRERVYRLVAASRGLTGYGQFSPGGLR